MLKKRENNYVQIILEPALSRLKNNQCPVCGKPQSEWKRRKDWRCCSVECTSKFEGFTIVRNWATLRIACFRRDKFQCQICKRHSIKQEPNISWDLEFAKEYFGDRFIQITDGMLYTYDDTVLGLIADHITPISIGGEQWDINNLQTLCSKCNKFKTKMDASIIAKYRKISLPKPVYSQLLLNEMTR